MRNYVKASKQSEKEAEAKIEDRNDEITRFDGTHLS